MDAMFEPLPDDEYPELWHVKTWDDALQEGANLREAGDSVRWLLGDLANHTCPNRKSGRPVLADTVEREHTLASFASSIGEDRATVSQVAANALFFKKEVRAELPPNVSWRMLAKARTKVGWKPGQPVTRGLISQAINLAFELADDAGLRPERTLFQDVKAACVSLERLNARDLKKELPLDHAAVRKAYLELRDLYDTLKEKEDEDGD